MSRLAATVLLILVTAQLLSGDTLSRRLLEDLGRREELGRRTGPERCLTKRSYQLRVIDLTLPRRVRTWTATCEPARSSCVSIAPSPSESWRKVMSSIKSGSTG